MSSEATPADQNKATVQRLVDEVVNLGHLHVADELFASDCVLHDPMMGTDDPMMGTVFSGWGSSQVKNIVETIRTAFPDVSFNIGAQTAAGSNHIVTEWTATGTHLGQLNQRPFEPTGEHVHVVGMSISRFNDGHIEEMWLINADVPDEGPGHAGPTFVCRHCKKCCGH
jgi:predicted ester cyclase